MNNQIPDHFFEELLLRVARRADELAARSVRPTRLNRECWLIAEAEILQLVPYFASTPETSPAGLVALAESGGGSRRFGL